nr:hypothetical protein [Candidatus Sigynarchaeota archaeon]
FMIKQNGAMQMAFPDTLPITGDFRLPLLIMEVLLVMEAVQIAFKFFKNYRTLQDTLRGSRMHAAWFGLFFTYSITTVLYIVADFFTLTENERAVILEAGYTIVASGALYYIFNIEKIAIIKTKRVFTVMFAALYVALLVLFPLSLLSIIEHGIVQYFAISFWIPMSLLFFTYAGKLNRLIKGKLKIFSGLMIVGLVLLIVGFLGATDIAIENIGIWVRLLGDGMQISGVFMMGIFFSLLPSWREIEWKETIESLYVVYKGGVPIFTYDFMSGDVKKEDESQSSVRMAQTLEVIGSLLSEVLNKGSLKILDMGTKKVIVEQGEHVLFALVANAELDSLKIFLRDFRIAFERFFPELDKWSGDPTEFELAHGLVGKVFKN